MVSTGLSWWRRYLHCCRSSTRILRITKILKYLPTLILVVVALSQIYFVNFKDLSPWYGGGFGMFSTSDVGTNRRFVVYVYSEGIKRELTIPHKLGKLSTEVANFPIRSRINKFVSELLIFKDINSNEISHLELQLFKRKFDKLTLESEFSLYKTFRVDINNER